MRKGGTDKPVYVAAVLEVRSKVVREVNVEVWLGRGRGECEQQCDLEISQKFAQASICAFIQDVANRADVKKKLLFLSLLCQHDDVLFMADSSSNAEFQ